MENLPYTSEEYIYNNHCILNHYNFLKILINKMNDNSNEHKEENKIHPRICPYEQTIECVMASWNLLLIPYGYPDSCN